MPDFRAAQPDKVMLQTGSRRESTHAFYRSCGFDPDEKTAYVSHPA